MTNGTEMEQMHGARRRAAHTSLFMQGKSREGLAASRRAMFAPLARCATEMASVLYLDAGTQPLGARHFLSRSVTSVDVSIRAVVIDALALEARAVLLAHNHPSGDAAPSELDISFTRRLFAALAAVEVRLLDHFIVTADTMTSFREARLL